MPEQWSGEESIKEAPHEPIEQGLSAEERAFQKARLRELKQRKRKNTEPKLPHPEAGIRGKSGLPEKPEDEEEKFNVSESE